MVSGSAASLAESLAASFSCAVSELAPMSGGDISRAFLVTLADGRRLFVKTHPRGHTMFEVEAQGLRWLAEAGALRTPDIAGTGSDEGPPWLALEFIDAGRGGPHHDEALGRGLASLHACHPPRVGWARENFVGSLTQDNRPTDDWPTFYGERRLRPLAGRAHDTGRLDARMLRRIEDIIERLPQRCGPAEPPSRLHGDLWSGNALVGADGLPVLIDPAVYAGHREIDLAMMRLFGGFSPRVFAAYEEAMPLHAEAADRVPLYQLYPLLVHVLLFGGGYVGQLAAALRQLGA